jgi:hypothetical protein
MITPGDAETGDLLHSHAQHVADFLARRVGDLGRGIPCSAEPWKTLPIRRSSAALAGHTAWPCLRASAAALRHHELGVITVALAVCLLFGRRSERAVRAPRDQLESLGVPSVRSHTSASRHRGWWCRDACPSAGQRLAARGRRAADVSDGGTARARARRAGAIAGERDHHRALVIGPPLTVQPVARGPLPRRHRAELRDRPLDHRERRGPRPRHQPHRGGRRLLPAQTALDANSGSFSLASTAASRRDGRRPACAGCSRRVPGRGTPPACTACRSFPRSTPATLAVPSTWSTAGITCLSLVCPDPVDAGGADVPARADERAELAGVLRCWPLPAGHVTTSDHNRRPEAPFAVGSPAPRRCNTAKPTPWLRFVVSYRFT